MFFWSSAVWVLYGNLAEVLSPTLFVDDLVWQWMQGEIIVALLAGVVYPPYTGQYKRPTLVANSQRRHTWSGRLAGVSDSCQLSCYF